MNYMRLVATYLFISLTAIGFAQAYDGQYEYIDLRDHIAFGTYNNLPTHTIQLAIENRPCEFSAPLNPATQLPITSLCNSKVTLTESGALGPQGTVSDEVFYPSQSRIDTRTNTIFSVEFDGPNSVKEIAQGIFEAQIMLFIHDEEQYATSKNYFFRRMLIQTDSSQLPIDNPERVKVIQVIEDIPLKDTQFAFYTDVLDRKTLMVDKTHNIIKVFPIGVGAFDVRTLTGMDQFIGSMTEELKTNAMITTDFPEGVYGQIQESRNKPGYYRGRPFLGIMDEVGTSSTSPMKYKQIGYHYQIDDDKLKRGFISHGCIRVRDKDLYQKSILVFSGLFPNIPVKVVNSFSQDSELYSYAYIDHPYTKINSGFKRIIYADKNYLDPAAQNQVSDQIESLSRYTDLSETERYVWCRKKGEAQPIRYHGPWASVLGQDCLTRTQYQNENVQPYIQYILGQTSYAPQISAFKVSSHKVSEPSVDTQQICQVSLTSAIQLYPQLTQKILDYKSYVNICGCQRLRQEFNRAKFQNERQIYQQFCSGQ